MDGNWYNFNDGEVTRITPSLVLENKTAAYVLFYLRRDYKPERFTSYTPVRFRREPNSFSIFVDINGRSFVKGSSKSIGCNCLIEALLACLKDNNILCVANVPWIRKQLQVRYANGNSIVKENTYLKLQNHWRDVIDLIGVSARRNDCDPENAIHAKNFSVTSVLADACIVDETVGDGPFILYVVNVGNGAFDPLIKDRQVRA